MAETSTTPTILTPGQAQPSEPVDKTPCGICHRQFARYTCPRCNLQYCSLTCFRSEQHAQCSEPFYRKELEIDIRAAPTEAAEERTRMMGLLKRFEEDTLEDPFADINELEEDEDEDELERRLGGMNLEDASYDQIWGALTPAERERFTKALNDPTSELAQTLLASQEPVAPWWEAPVDIPSEDESNIEGRVPWKKYGRRPELMVIPPSLAQPAGDADEFSLAHNLVAILLAYAYMTRRLGVSPLSSLAPADLDTTETRTTIARLAPFLADKRSKSRFESVQAVVTDVWSRCEPGTMNSQLLAVLLRDAATLLRQDRVTVVSDTPAGETHAATTLGAFSDLHALFAQDARQAHVAAKLRFYAAQVLRAPPELVALLIAETRSKAARVEEEAEGAAGGAGEVERVGELKDAGGDTEPKKLITEVS